MLFYLLIVNWIKFKNICHKSKSSKERTILHVAPRFVVIGSIKVPFLSCQTRERPYSWACRCFVLREHSSSHLKGMRFPSSRDEGVTPTQWSCSTSFFYLARRRWSIELGIAVTRMNECPRKRTDIHAFIFYDGPPVPSVCRVSDE